jgi:cysteine desulfurase
MTRRVYLDHNASTPVHPEVVAEMTPYFGEMFGNPSSVHGFGRDAREGIDIARDRIARFVKVPPDQIVFTSGGTESDNFGIKGLALARGRGHLITSAIEHHAVLRTVQALETQGFTATYLPVDAQGRVDPADTAMPLRSRPSTIDSDSTCR